MTEIDKTARPELTDIVTGEVFIGRAHNHYEFNDGKPKAPAVDLPRPTLRQRVEFLTRQQPDILARYMSAGDDNTNDDEFDVPDDPEAPLTASERNLLDIEAAFIAEHAPLPDEGLPRDPLPPEVPPQAAGGGGGAAQPPAPPAQAAAPLPPGGKSGTG